MTCPSTVRIATAHDAPEIWRLFLEGQKDFSLFTMAPDKVNWILSRVLCPETIPLGDTALRGVMGVIGKVGALEAICGLCISDLWYTHDKHLGDFLVFVDPVHRSSKHAQALIEWMKYQSDILGLPFISGVITNQRTEAKCRLFRRMIPKIGETFFYSGTNSERPAVTIGE